MSILSGAGLHLLRINMWRDTRTIYKRLQTRLFPSCGSSTLKNTLPSSTLITFQLSCRYKSFSRITSLNSTSGPKKSSADYHLYFSTFLSKSLLTILPNVARSPWENWFKIIVALLPERFQPNNLRSFLDGCRIPAVKEKITLMFGSKTMILTSYALWSTLQVKIPKDYTTSKFS